MAEILKAESYTAVTKTAKEEVYTLFIKAFVNDGGGNVQLVLDEGASVGAYKITVSGDTYTLTLNPPTGFLDDTVFYPVGGGLGTINAPWNFLGAPTVTLNYANSGLVDDDAIIPVVTDYNWNDDKRPYIKFGFLKQSGGTGLPTATIPPENSEILITLRYTTTDKK